MAVVSREQKGVTGAEGAEVAHLDMLNQYKEAECQKLVLTVPLPSHKVKLYILLV